MGLVLVFFFGFGWKDGNGRVGFEQRVGFGFGFGVKNESKLDMREIGESVACEVGVFFLIYFGYSLCGSDTWAKVEPALTSNSFTHTLSLMCFCLQVGKYTHGFLCTHSM